MDPEIEVELKLGQGHITRASYADLRRRIAIHMALNGAPSGTNTPMDEISVKEQPKLPTIKLRAPQNRTERRAEARRRRRRNG